MTISARHIAAGFGAITLALLPIVGLGASASASSSVSAVISTEDGQLEEQYSSAVSPDGSIIAIPSHQRSTVTFLHTADNTLTTVSDLGGYIAFADELVFSPDGSTLYVGNGTFQDTVAVVDVATATAVDSITVGSVGVSSIAISADGVFLAVATDMADITVVDLSNNNNVLGTVTSDGAYVNYMYFDSNGLFQLVSADNKIQSLDPYSGEFGPITSFNIGVSFSYWCGNADNSVLAAIGDNNKVSLVNTSDGSTIAETTLSSENAVYLDSCSFTGNGALVITDSGVSNSGDGVVYVLDDTTLDLLETVATPGVEDTNSVTITADCTAYVPGYYQNIAVLTLDPSYCPPIAPSPSPTSTPSASPAALASTGTDTGSIAAAAAFALAAIAAGALIARRRARA